MASLNCCKSLKSCRSNAVADSGSDQPSTSKDGEEKDCTEVKMDDSAESLGDVDAPWSINSLFRTVFHATPDSRVAVKLYGSKNGVLKEKMRQEKSKSGSKWMIHPYSHFR